MRMLKTERVLENVYRRLLREASLDSVNTSDMAAMVDDSGNSRIAVVYSVSKLLDAVKRGSYAKDKNYVIGFVKVSEPKGAPCRKAWQVKGIAGPGKIVYGLAYALSPSGLIVPDRSDVSPAASSAWLGYANKTDEKNILPLDDADHPKKGSDPYHDEHHTEDPNDDCYTAHEEEHLNAAYRGPGGEGALLDRLVDSHESVIKRLRDSGFDVNDVEGEILDGGYSKFDSAMGY